MPRLQKDNGDLVDVDRNKRRICLGVEGKMPNRGDGKGVGYVTVWLSLSEAETIVHDLRKAVDDSCAYILSKR